VLFGLSPLVLCQYYGSSPPKATAQSAYNRAQYQRQAAAYNQVFLLTLV